MANPRLAAALSFTPPPKLEKPAVDEGSCAGGIKLSFSLFPADTDRLDAICDMMASKGHKISKSHAIRLALRGVELKSERLVKLLETMREDDGRRRRAKPRP